MISAYFDDSSDNKRQKYVSVGGFIAPVIARGGERISALNTLELRWMLATDLLHQPFHSTDCETRQGQFREWSVPQSAELMKSLVSIIVDSHVIPFGIVVPVQEFVTVFPSMDEYGPFILAVQSALAYLGNFASMSNQDLHVMIEDSACSGKTRKAYDRLRSCSGWPGASRLSGLGFGNKQSIALQAADLIARECFKHFDNLEHATRPTRKPLSRLLSKAMVLNCYTPAALSRLRSIGWPGEVKAFASEIR